MFMHKRYISMPFMLQTELRIYDIYTYILHCVYRCITFFFTFFPKWIGTYTFIGLTRSFCGLTETFYYYYTINIYINNIHIHSSIRDKNVVISKNTNADYLTNGYQLTPKGFSL